MGNASHTPGPWIVFTSEDDWGCDTFVGTLTDTLFDVRPGKGPSWQDANARLIAAAPDLLAALKELSAVYSGIHVQISDGEAALVHAAWAKADAAIAKAEGAS